MTTGWFGIPGKTPLSNVKVHVVHQGRTLCGWTPSPDHQFQLCASGIAIEMVECSACRASALRFLEGRHREK